MNYFRAKIQADIRTHQKSYQHRARRTVPSPQFTSCPICGSEINHPLIKSHCLFCGKSFFSLSREFKR